MQSSGGPRSCTAHMDVAGESTGAGGRHAAGAAQAQRVGAAAGFDPHRSVNSARGFVLYPDFNVRWWHCSSIRTLATSTKMERMEEL